MKPKKPSRDEQGEFLANVKFCAYDLTLYGNELTAKEIKYLEEHAFAGSWGIKQDGSVVGFKRMDKMPLLQYKIDLTDETSIDFLRLFITYFKSGLTTEDQESFVLTLIPVDEFETKQKEVKEESLVFIDGKLCIYSYWSNWREEKNVQKALLAEIDKISDELP